MKFNINNYVKVKLTDKGRKVLEEEHNQLYARLGLGDVAYEAPKEDENGYHKFQLWCLMESLGRHLSLGTDPVFETEIELVTPPMIQFVDAQDLPSEIIDYCVEHEINTHHQSDIIHIKNDGNVFAKWLVKEGYKQEGYHFTIAIQAT